MRKESILLLLGLLVVAIPLMGVPLVWKEYALYGIGALVLFIGLLCRLEVRRRERRAVDAAYEEHDPGAYTQEETEYADETS